jgi:NAD(P)-dependent dehydrogenase (short-subunit alcohol dehydrogenase family)
VRTINNKHVLITGGASGIGRRLVLRCAEMGAAVSILDLDKAGAEATARGSPSAPPTSSPPRARWTSL